MGLEWYHQRMERNMKRRKRVTTHNSESIDEISAIAKRYKEINGNAIQLEINEDTVWGCWILTVWDVR